MGDWGLFTLSPAVGPTLTLCSNSSFFPMRGWDAAERATAVFGFVRICSDLFRVVRDAPEGLTARVDNGGGGVVGFAVLLGFAGWGGG